MNKIWPAYEDVLWYLKRPAPKPCMQDMHVDVAVVGGGVAGLAAAQEFAKKGKKVALFEQYFCGSGASGKSSGFVTPNAELSLTDFATRFNMDAAHEIWKLISGGVQSIKNNIEQNSFDCGYVKEDSLFASLSLSELKSMQIEHDNLEKLGYSTVLYDQHSIRSQLGSQKYYGGVLYTDTFGMNAYAYCQSMARLVESMGVLVFEETPVTAIKDHTLTTAHAKITADHIVICVDRFLPDLGFLVDDVYQVQNFVMASQQLTDQQIKAIFPQRNYMVWDTQLIYNYFRLTSDRRLLLGGGDLWSTYANKPTHGYERISRKLTDYFSTTFPQVNIQFEFLWSGLIGLSKDIAPIIGRDKDFSHIYYVAAVAGLPIAQALGAYSAQHILEGRSDMDEYFSPYRKFPVGGLAQRILGKKISFAISNVIKQNIP